MTERWVNGLLRKELDRHTRKHGGATANWFELHEIAVKLLARQHRAMVRKVRKVGQVTTSQFGTSNEAMAWRTACAEILAALAKQGGGK